MILMIMNHVYAIDASDDSDDLYIIGAVSFDEKVTSSLYVCNRAERRRLEARRETLKTPLTGHRPMIHSRPAGLRPARA